jgi:hypothetical protein
VRRLTRRIRAGMDPVEPWQQLIRRFDVKL